MINPMQVIQMITGGRQNIQNNPIVRNAYSMKNTNDINGLQKLAENLAKEKGVDLKGLQNQIQQRYWK